MPLQFLLAIPVQPAVPSLQKHVSVKPKTLGELLDTPDACAAIQKNLGRLEHWTHRDHVKFSKMYSQEPHSEDLPTKVEYLADVYYH